MSVRIASNNKTDSELTAEPGLAAVYTLPLIYRYSNNAHTYRLWFKDEQSRAEFKALFDPYVTWLDTMPS
jgi:hypothetical protein